MVIDEVGGFVFKSVLEGVGEWFVRTFNRLRGEKKTFGEGTTAALEIEKRQMRRTNKTKGGHR